MVHHSPISLGCEVKSLSGTGIFFVIYSHTTSMLYFNWADIGITGAPSAIVPVKYEQGKCTIKSKVQMLLVDFSL